MRTISHFLGRKGVAAAVVPVAAPAQQGTNGIEGRGEVTFADLGTRIGEDNETLRNLLLDTDRRLTSLDELKVTFRSLVEPIGAALRSLEQEKTDNVDLAQCAGGAAHQPRHRAQGIAHLRKTGGGAGER